MLACLLPGGCGRGFVKEIDAPLCHAMPGMKLGAGRGLRVFCGGFGGGGGAEGACWGWRAVRRHRVARATYKACRFSAAGQIAGYGHSRGRNAYFGPRPGPLSLARATGSA